MKTEANIYPKQAKEILSEQSYLQGLDEEIDAERKLNDLELELGLASSKAQLLLEERADIIRMRRCWSYWLLGAIIAITIFDFFVILAVGFGWMKYQNNYAIPFFVGESFLKTMGLAIVVVMFLFDKKQTNNE